jgi:hypothetical protein
MKIGVNLHNHGPFAAEVRPLVTSPGAELCSALH